MNSAPLFLFFSILISVKAQGWYQRQYYQRRKFFKFVETADIASYPKPGEIFSRDRNGVAILEGDIKIKASWERRIQSQYSGGAFMIARAFTNIYQTWDKSGDYVYIPYIVDHLTVTDGGTTVTNLNHAINDLNQNTCIRLVPRNTEVDYIEFRGGSGCSSYIGKIGGMQPITLQQGTSCTGKGTILHEIMHSLGFFHEQSRADRDTYVTINEANIREGFENNFVKQSTNSHNSLYDFGSVLHYPLNAFSKDSNLRTIEPKVTVANEDEIGQRIGMSVEDIKQINAAYCGQSIPPPEPCENIKPLTRCERWKSKGFCENNKRDAQLKCKKTCGLCTANSSNESFKQGDATKQRQPNRKKPIRFPCEDIRPAECRQVRKNCKKYSFYAKHFCAKSCNYC